MHQKFITRSKAVRTWRQQEFRQDRGTLPAVDMRDLFNLVWKTSSYYQRLKEIRTFSRRPQTLWEFYAL